MEQDAGWKQAGGSPEAGRGRHKRKMLPSVISYVKLIKLVEDSHCRRQKSVSWPMVFIEIVLLLETFHLR